jgi:hypothetical protein
MASESSAKKPSAKSSSLRNLKRQFGRRMVETLLMSPL